MLEGVQELALGLFRVAGGLAIVHVLQHLGLALGSSIVRCFV